MEEDYTPVDKLLEVEIASKFDDLESLKPGADGRAETVDELVKLYKLKIEEEKNLWDANDRASQNETDNDLKRKQLEESKKDRYFKLGIAVAELILPLAFYGAWMNKGFEFEKNGAISSTTFRGLINRFRPTKK